MRFLLKEYYKNKNYTNEVLKNGWFNTGDKGFIDNKGYLHITGRVKDIFKTSKGKYIEPSVIESKFEKINLFQQICIVGMNLPQPILLAVPNELALFNKFETNKKVEDSLIKINKESDNYKKIKKIVFVKEEWNPENNLTTPTLKIKRAKIDERYANNYENWFEQEESIIWE